MKKREQIFNFLNSEMTTDKKRIKEGPELVETIKKKWNLAEGSARKYYYEWKGGFMNTEKCVPKIEASRLKENSPIKKSEKLIIDDRCISIKEGCIKQSLEEAIQLKEDKYINPNLEVLKMNIKGKYGVYEKEGSRVKKGELIFKTEKDIEEYKHNEISRFMAELGEILDVMLMEV